MQQRIEALCEELAGRSAIAELGEKLRAASESWSTLTSEIAQRAQGDAEEAGAAAFDYLMVSGYVCVAYFWARMASVAERALEAGARDGASAALYSAKLHTARFYFTRLLPRMHAHAAAIRAGKRDLMAIAEQGFVG
jgi:hypothetical protein